MTAAKPQCKPTHIRGIRSERVLAILAVLKQHGPITSAAISEKTEIPPHVVGTTISVIRRNRPGAIRIARWLPPVGLYGRTLAEFELGSEPDAPLVKRTAPSRKKRVGHKRAPLVPPMPTIPDSKLPPMAWMAMQPIAQMSARW